VDPDRRRQIARDLLAKIDAIPVGADGRGDFDVHDLVAAMKLETDLVSECTDAMERAHRIEAVLDSALVALGGWRHRTLAELRGDEAAAFYRLSASQAVTDK
jgi:hypothetical protein